MRRLLGTKVRFVLAAGVASASLLGLGTLVSVSWASFVAGSSTADSSLSSITVAPPVLSSAVSQAGGAVALTWTATPTAAQRPDLTFAYNIYRSNGGAAVLVNASPVTGLTYTDVPPSDGTWTYTAIAVVSSFQSPPSNAVSGLSDRVAPGVSISCGTGACTTAWYRAPVTVTLSATDAGTGVRSIAYVLDGVSSSVNGATTAFTVGDGAHTIVYSATDQAGNTSLAATQALNIDSTPPTVGAPVICDLSGVAPPGPAGWISASSTYRILAVVSDATSGVGSATASVSVSGAGVIASGVPLSAQALTCGGASYSYASAPLTAPALLPSGSGIVAVTATATDVAGNSANASGSGGVDNAAPTVGSFRVTNGAVGSGQLIASWSASDALSGVAGYELDVYLKGTTTRPSQYPAPVIFGAGTTTTTLSLVSGTHYDVYLVAADNAGNNTAPTPSLNHRAP